MAQSKPCSDNLPEVKKIGGLLSANQLAARFLTAKTGSPEWRCSVKALGKVLAVAFREDHYIDHWQFLCQEIQLFIVNPVLVLVEPPFEKDPKITAARVDEMLKVLVHCQIKYLSLEGNPLIEFEDVATFKKLLDALPKLECLYYGGFQIKKFNDAEWQSLCQEFGPRLKHLTIDGPVKRKQTIQSLISASVNLELVHLKPIVNKKSYYLKSLCNRSFEVSLEFVEAEYKCHKVAVDGDTAEVIHRAKNLSIRFGCLQKVARHFPKFDRLNRLDLAFRDDEAVEAGLAMEFPALEHLSWTFGIYNPTPVLSHWACYNLESLKSLTVSSTANNDILTPVISKLTRLEELTLDCIAVTPVLQWPGDLVLQLQQLEELNLDYVLRDVEDLPKVVRLFDGLRAMAEMKRCKISIDCDPLLVLLNQVSEDLKQQLRRAQTELRQALGERSKVKIKMLRLTEDDVDFPNPFEGRCVPS